MAKRLARLRADARYHRNRRDLYRAKVYGPRPTRPERLEELERTFQRAAERLREAQAEAEAQGDAGPPRSREGERT